MNVTATTEIHTLSLHDALPIYPVEELYGGAAAREDGPEPPLDGGQADGGRDERRQHDAPEQRPDRKSTRLNSSHSQSSYAVFCLKKKISTRLKVKTKTPET